MTRSRSAAFDPKELLNSTGLLQGYREVLTALSSAPSHTLESKSQIYELAIKTLSEFRDEWKGAGTIARIQRGRKGRKEADMLKQTKQHEDNAATKLQSSRRASVAKLRVNKLRKERDDNAAGMLQKIHRGNQSRQTVAKLKQQREDEIAARNNNAAIRLQSHARRRSSVGEFNLKKEEHQKKVLEEETGAATKLQSMHRVKIAKKNVQRKKDGIVMEGAATRLQAVQRGKIERNTRKTEVKAVSAVQKIHRGNIDRGKYKEKKKQHKSAVLLQAQRRGGLDRARTRQKKREKSMLPVGDGLIHIGDVVKARVGGDILYCEGIVIGKSGTEGIDEYDVDFGDGDVQEHVPRTNIMKVNNWDVLEIGDVVKSPVPGMGKLRCDAVVKNYLGEINGEPTYDVEFADGEVAENIKHSLLVKVSSTRTKAVQQWHKGTNAISAVSAFADKKWGVYRRLSVSQITPLVKK